MRREPEICCATQNTEGVNFSQKNVVLYQNKTGYMKNIVITGVSTGIGYATAKKFIAEGHRVFGSVRKQSDADALTADLGLNFEPLIFDVARVLDLR